jgi:hypothetical protein
MPKRFLQDVFVSIDPNYNKYGALLWEIYRNGPVHQYSPKILKDRKSHRTIGWISHKGERTYRLGDPYNFQAEHLVPHDHGNGRWSQPISILCLYEDLLSAIDKYILLIQDSRNGLESRFRKTADALTDPDEVNAVEQRIKWW